MAHLGVSGPGDLGDPQLSVLSYLTLSDMPLFGPLSSLPCLISGSTSPHSHPLYYPIPSIIYCVSMSRYDFIDYLDWILLVGQPRRSKKSVRLRSWICKHTRSRFWPCCSCLSALLRLCNRDVAEGRSFGCCRTRTGR